ncbi:unnamed protein product [Umbelopsis ramanniana]
MRKIKRGNLVTEVRALPFALRADIIDKTHQGFGHLGSLSILDIMRKRYWWPYMRQDITETIARCLQCQLAQGTGKATHRAPQPVCRASPFQNGDAQNHLSDNQQRRLFDKYLLKRRIPAHSRTRDVAQVPTIRMGRPPYPIIPPLLLFADDIKLQSSTPMFAKRMLTIVQTWSIHNSININIRKSGVITNPVTIPLLLSLYNEPLPSFPRATTSVCHLPILV